MILQRLLGWPNHDWLTADPCCAVHCRPCKSLERRPGNTAAGQTHRIYCVGRTLESSQHANPVRASSEAGIAQPYVAAFAQLL